MRELDNDGLPPKDLVVYPLYWFAPDWEVARHDFPLDVVLMRASDSLIEQMGPALRKSSIDVTEAMARDGWDSVEGAEWVLITKSFFLRTEKFSRYSSVNLDSLVIGLLDIDGDAPVPPEPVGVESAEKKDFSPHHVYDESIQWKLRDAFVDCLSLVNSVKVRAPYKFYVEGDVLFDSIDCKEMAADDDGGLEQRLREFDDAPKDPLFTLKKEDLADIETVWPWLARRQGLYEHFEECLDRAAMGQGHGLGHDSSAKLLEDAWRYFDAGENAKGIWEALFRYIYVLEWVATKGRGGRDLGDTISSRIPALLGEEMCKRRDITEKLLKKLYGYRNDLGHAVRASRKPIDVEKVRFLARYASASVLIKLITDQSRRDDCLNCDQV